MRKRTYTLAAATLIATATIAGGRAAVAALLGAERTEQTLAGSNPKSLGRESSLEIAGSKGVDAKIARESS